MIGEAHVFPNENAISPEEWYKHEYQTYTPYPWVDEHCWNTTGVFLEGIVWIGTRWVTGLELIVLGIWWHLMGYDVFVHWSCGKQQAQSETSDGAYPMSYTPFLGNLGLVNDLAHHIDPLFGEAFHYLETLAKTAKTPRMARPNSLGHAEAGWPSGTSAMKASSLSLKAL